MNVHKNARSCLASRAELVKRVCELGWSVREASEAVGISERRGREWIRRSAAGEPLTDRSSRPHRSHRIEQQTREQIVALRREWRTMRQIAQTAGVSQSTVARICRSAGLSRLRQLDPPAVPVRYERQRPGELLHVDIKRLGRFDRVGHRITRRRSFGSKKQGFEFVYAATDDFTRLCYVDILADERSEAASTFLERAVSWFAQQNVCVERVMTDNGSAFVSRQFNALCGTSVTYAFGRTRHEPTARSSASSRHCYANGRTASPTRTPKNDDDGSPPTCTSITSTVLIRRSVTIHQSVAWIGTTS
jgi:transposase